MGTFSGTLLGEDERQNRQSWYLKMFFDHKKKLISSTVLLILMFDLDVVKGCSGGSSDEATTKAPYPTTTMSYDYEMKNKTWNDTQCKQLADEPMKMPAGGLEECKKTCDGNTECYAFEYSVKGDCCVFREMCDPKEPTVTNATHHGDQYTDYKGYVKVSSTMSTSSS